MRRFTGHRKKGLHVVKNQPSCTGPFVKSTSEAKTCAAQVAASDGRRQRLDEADSSLSKRIHGALARVGQEVSRRFDVQVEQDEVVLRGVVRSWYQKQLAQESLRAIAGVERIRNELEVVPGEVEFTPQSESDWCTS